MHSKAYKQYVVMLLMTVYIFNQADRAIFTFLAEPIKAELGLSDTELGFLAGPALIILYATLGVPVARLADRYSRVNIISVAVALWSTIVALSATVGNFWQFAVARMGVGIGEAGFTAVAQSLIGDYHKKEERGRAMAAFMLGIPLGAAISMFAAGWLNQFFGWRAVFLAFGLPGLLLAVLVKFSIKEPIRSFDSVRTDTPADRPKLASVFSTLWSHRALRHLAVGQGILNVLAACVGWIPVFFMRNHQLPSGELGTLLSVVAAVGGAGGIWLGGYLTTKVGQRGDHLKAQLMALAPLFIVPLYLAILYVSSPYLALGLLVPLYVAVFFAYGPTFAFVHALSPGGMQATMASVFILIQVMAGGVLGVQLIGIASDILTPVGGSSAAGLRLSMTFACPLGFWAAFHFWAAARALRSGTSPGQESGFPSPGSEGVSH